MDYRSSVNGLINNVIQDYSDNRYDYDIGYMSTITKDGKTLTTGLTFAEEQVLFDGYVDENSEDLYWGNYGNSLYMYRA